MTVVGYKEKKEKNSVWQLTGLLLSIDESIHYYKEYLNTGNKDTWDYYNIKSTISWFGYSIMIDKKYHG